MIVTNKIARWIVGIANRFNKGFNIVAVTIWPFIFLYPPESETLQLIRHERKHLEQWESYWLIGFLPVYFWQYKKYGYWNMPLEVEARNAEKQ